MGQEEDSKKTNPPYSRLSAPSEALIFISTRMGRIGRDGGFGRFLGFVVWIVGCIWFIVLVGLFC